MKIRIEFEVDCNNVDENNVQTPIRNDQILDVKGNLIENLSDRSVAEYLEKEICNLNEMDIATHVSNICFDVTEE